MKLNTFVNTHSEPQAQRETAAPAKHSPVSHDEFHAALGSAIASSPKVKEYVHHYAPHEYSQMKTFLHPDKKSGFAVKPDGDIVSVFSTEKGRGDEIVQHAKEAGGKKLDAFDGYLPKLYNKHGFQEYSREKNWTPGGPDVVYMRLHPFSSKGPLLGKHEEKYARPLSKGEDNIQAEYKKNARKQCGISFPVKVKGRSKLSDEIKLHMSLKCFNSKDEFTIPELIKLAKELDIDKPDLSDATFKPTIFTNEHTKNTYYMLIIEGLDPKYKKFCDHFKGVGVTHAKFMSHITIDKALYDQIKKDGIKASELEFSGLILEHGAGNRLHTFEESLEKGLNGDWKKEGYTLIHKPHPSDESYFEIHAHDSKGNKVGHANFTHHDDGKHIRSYDDGIPYQDSGVQVRVNHGHERKGLATAMYAHAEKVTGKKLKNVGKNKRTEDGKALWAQKNRPFGKAESLEKGPIKNTLAALGVAGSLATASTTRDNANASTQPAPQAHISQRAPASVAPKQSPYDHKRMLHTISSVESNNGKYENHKELAGIHHGESAFGKYGLTPVIIRETVHLNHDLQGKHKKLLALRGDDLHRYMEDNPGLEDTIADKHLKRLEHHFGQEPGTLGYAWLNGVKGTYKAKKDSKDIANHWHVKKINDAYSKGK